MTARPALVPDATEALVDDVHSIRTDREATRFESRRLLARRLGASHDPDSGLTTFGLWAPEVEIARVPDRSVHLELYTAVEPVDPARPRQAAVLQRDRVELVRDGDYWWGVLSGVTAGTAEALGTLYWLRAERADEEPLIVRDLLAHSIPFGSFAPAEVYDVVSLQRGRKDREHFAAPVEPPTSILELHVPTATAEGTIGALASVYRRIGVKLRQGEPLTPREQVYADYDAVQPLPVDPTIERRAGGDCFLVTDVVDELEGLVGVLLRHPDNQNWGYDNMVASSSATNPSLLGTRRPDELVALAEALHALPEPMLLIYDLVYGHADNQALDVLPTRFVKGPNMYGQDLDHQDPTVRAVLLEMQRRRMDTGCDGLRVDGAQDFRYYDPRSGQVLHDDDFLREMSAVEQEIGGHRRRVWMIFEDGRPWPDEGWETASTYRDVIDDQPDVFQWGPLIFAHNTPMLEGFWVDKWWRVEEMVRHGGHWISGCANHDTVRRGTQVDHRRPLNGFLGETLPEILDNAYDNAAVNTIVYGLLPGIPMDFLNATTRTPWAFMRTTDDRYGVKVMAEEAGFLDWQVSDEGWDRSTTFRRIKRYGVTTRTELRELLDRIGVAIDETDHDLAVVAATVAGPALLAPTREGLLAFAHHFMQDVHELCNVGPYLDALDPDRVAHAAALRRLRRRHPWLRDDCGPHDGVRHEPGPPTVYLGHRHDPQGRATVAAVANMAGPEAAVAVDDVVPEGCQVDDATICLLGGGARIEDGVAVLADGAGITWVWERPGDP